MIESKAISGQPPADLLLDFDHLFTDGLAMLEAGTDGRWTDFNTHDPGITILELLCYALTDLGYRAGHPMADLLAGTPQADAAAELSGNAVTASDLRRIVLDTEGVRNAWIEPAWGGPLDLIRKRGSRSLEFDPGSRGSAPAGVESVRLQGVYRVLIEKSPHYQGTNADVVQRAALRIHAQRGLCEDFDEIRVLDPKPVAVYAELEIADTGMAESVLLDAYLRMDAYMSPVPARQSVIEQRAAGMTGDDIFEGPRLARGTVDLSGDRPLARKTTLHSSDVIAELTKINGVRVVRQVQLGGAAGDDWWAYPLDASQSPVFDARASSIRLFIGGTPIEDEVARARALERFDNLIRQSEAASTGLASPAARPAGTDRQLDAYRPLGADLPLVYGTRPGSLSGSAPSARRAQANHLRAYLAIFDQLLANYFGQLALFRNLVSAGTDLESACYAVNLVPPDGGDPVVSENLTADELRRQVEASAGASAHIRRERFLAHLLARIGEQAPLTIPAGAGADTVTVARQAFLRDSVRLSAGRGTGADYLSGADAPLCDRVRLKLGLPKDPPCLLVIEHILLRPTAADAVQVLPVLNNARSLDPYSLQLTFVVSDRLKPLAEAVTRVVREETPAHLTPYLMLLNDADFAAFSAAYSAWMASLKELRQQQMGIRI